MDVVVAVIVGVVIKLVVFVIVGIVVTVTAVVVSAVVKVVVIVVVSTSQELLFSIYPSEHSQTLLLPFSNKLLACVHLHWSFSTIAPTPVHLIHGVSLTLSLSGLLNQFDLHIQL